MLRRPATQPGLTLVPLHVGYSAWNAATLTLRRANVSRISGHWQNDAYTERWFWGVSFMLTNRRSYGHAGTLEDAKAACRAEYEGWLQDQR